MTLRRAAIVRNPNAILFLAADRNYTLVYFRSNTTELIADTLALFAQDLPGFVRIHRSYLVNPRYITSYRYQPPMSIFVSVAGQQLPVSRRQARKLRQLLKHSSVVKPIEP